MSGENHSHRVEQIAGSELPDVIPPGSIMVGWDDLEAPTRLVIRTEGNVFLAPDTALEIAERIIDHATSIDPEAGKRMLLRMLGFTASVEQVTAALRAEAAARQAIADRARRQ